MLTVMRYIIVALLLAYSHSTIAGTLDDYYLQQFGEAGTSIKSSKLLSTSAISDRPGCGMPVKKKLRQDWDTLQPATQKALAKQLSAPVLTGEATIISTHFRFHYATSGSDAPPSADLNLNLIPDWVETVATTFEDVYSYYQNQGYRMPPTADGYYDVYLRDLAYLSFYGLTTSTTSMPATGYPNSFGSYLEIDNNYTDSIFINASGGPYTELQSLQITAAHEFHHAIQYGYNYYFDIWFAEATSTWFEDEINAQYDSVNQLYNYLPAWFRNSTRSIDIAVDSSAISTGAGYSRWLFNRYLAEQFGSGVVLNAWQSLAPLGSPGGGADIPMTPVLDTLLVNSYSSTFSTQFSGFTKRAYLRNWSSHVGEIGKIHDIVPLATFNSYPVNILASLSHYSFAYFSFTPSAAVTALTITVNKSSGITSTVFLNRNGFVTEVSPNSADTVSTYTVNSFSQLNAATDEVVLLLANTTSIDNHAATFSTDGNSPAVADPTVPTSGGGSSGCFIATAAYGSYLHPQVQALRNFRDNHLLTNAPGRAFVAMYYSASPPIADFIAQHESLKILVRWCLTPLVFTVTHPLLAFAAFVILAAMFVLKRRLKRLPITALNPTSEVP